MVKGSIKYGAYRSLVTGGNYRNDDWLQCKAVPVLLRMAQSGDDALKEEALEALALLGYTAPVKGRGIRILTLDGGGTR